MPELTGGQVTTLLGGLGVAMTGIMGFIVGSASLWLVLAAALMVFYLFKKWTNLNKVKIPVSNPSYKIVGKGKFVPSSKIPNYKSKL